MNPYEALAEAIFDAGKDVLAVSLADFHAEAPDDFLLLAGYYVDGPDLLGFESPSARPES